MAWKQKEKQLTPEEALAVAKQELTRYWFGSEPLLAGVRGENGVATAHVLTNTFHEKTWLFFFLDPTRFSGDGCITYAREWHRRYQLHGLSAIIIIKPPYEFYRASDSILPLMRRQQISFPFVIDADGAISEAFRAQALPKIAIFSKRQFIMEVAGNHWMNDFELELQKYLRKSDPGAPFLLPFEKPKNFTDDVSSIEFGRLPKQGVALEFPEPGFGEPVKGIAQAHFNPGERPSGLGPGEFYISGKWSQDGEKIYTHDADASIGFLAPTKQVSIIAQSLAKITEPAKIQVEVNGISAPEAVAAEHLTLDEDGRSLVKLEGGNFYHVLHNLLPRKRDITFKFPTADRLPVALYGIRMGD